MNNPDDVLNKTNPIFPIPPQVQGLKWVIDDTHSLMFNEYGTIDLCHKERYGVQGRITIEDAKNYGRALLAAVAALEGRSDESPSVEVVDWRSEQLISKAESVLEDIDRRVKELLEVREELKKRISSK